MKTKNIISVFLTGAALFVSACATDGASASSVGSGVKPYPLKTCLVTDNKLDSMGDERTTVYQGQEIKFCCESCEPKFLKNPEKFLPKLK